MVVEKKKMSLAELHKQHCCALKGADREIRFEYSCPSPADAGRLEGSVLMSLNDTFGDCRNTSIL